MIDAIGPFFRGYDRKRINWSKIPFDHLQLEGAGRRTQFDRIAVDLDQLAGRVAALGFNAVSLDDVVHLVDHPWYESAIRTRIAILRDEYQRLFEVLNRHGLAIYLTMDVLSETPALAGRLGSRESAINDFVAEQLERLFTDFPAVAGVIVRIGESDGLDVAGDFVSRLHFKSAAMVNRFVRRVLPAFERHGRRMVLRTWTVGAYRIGDLIWHRGTFRQVLKNIDSPALVLSMKYGETDFFRFLPLNAAFFRTRVPKVIELQTRREYEGCGEYPSFIGWDYEHYARELRQAPNVIGISVWCQTGGWTPFRRLAYIDAGSPWTELNTFVTVGLFRRRLTVEELLEEWAGSRDPALLIELCRLSDEVIKELLYVEEFARQKLFFRRVRIPPLIGVYWHTIFVSHSVRKLMRHFVLDGETCVRTGYAALGKIKEMEQLAVELDLPAADLVFMRRTFKLLALARQYYFAPYDEAVRRRLLKARRKYKRQYPKGTRPRYTVRMDFDPFRLNSRLLRWALALALRRRRGYRVVDYLLTLHVLSYLYRLIRARRPSLIPKFARKSAMGIDVVFR